MSCKRSLGHKILVSVVVSIFFFNTVTVSASCGFSSAQDKLAPPLRFIKGLPTKELLTFQNKFRYHLKFRTAILLIAEHFLKNEGTKENLREALRAKFSDVADKEQFLQDLFISLDGIDGNKDGITIPFEINDVPGKARITVNAENPEQQYFVQISQDRSGEDGSDHEADLKGSRAPKTDPVIDELIKNGRVAELYINEKGELKANRIKWVDDYRPGQVTFDEYYRQGIGLNQLFSSSETENLKVWIRSHNVRGAPVKIRIVLGAASVGWRSNIDDSNIVHAGLRDGAIYIGSLLLKHLAQAGNEELMEEILDKDEYAHLLGEDHHFPGKDVTRLKLLTPFITSVEEVRRAMLDNDVNFLNGRLKCLLNEPIGDLLDFLLVCNDVCLSQPLFPIESKYPIKHAIALLSAENKKKLIDILKSSSETEGYRDITIIDDILLMFDEVVKIKDWVKVHAPELEFRSLWEISPEIWHEAGGLARVMQYHGVAMHTLIGDAKVRFRTLEPWYQHRVVSSGGYKPLDYTKDLTHSIAGELREVDRFKVMVGEKEVTAVVARGVNDLGIEVFVIKDLQSDGNSFYTHSLYNYRRNAFVDNPTLPTWDEFSVFFSAATFEFINRFENKEKTEIENRPETWKPPILHINDSQTALISIYRRIRLDEEKAKKGNDPDYAIDPVLKGEVIQFTTHTYGNRRVYDKKIGPDVLNFMGVPSDYQEYCLRLNEEGKPVYDMASLGLRFADGQNAVARAHRDDVAQYDEWVNDPGNRLYDFFQKAGIDVNVIAISNGDDRAASARIFRETMLGLYDDADVEHPTPAQVFHTKSKAKEQLCLDKDQKYFTSREEPGLLDPGRPVVSYSGRLVKVKAGRERAFTDENIERLVTKGVQVVIYGNVQANQDSEDIAKGIIDLIAKLKDKKYSGKLVFVPRFSLNDQRALLAATDIQVQDSDEHTEAAGYTESDISACGGLQLAPPYKEGLLQAQGLLMNFRNPGEGNTIVPKNKTPEAYYDSLAAALDLVQPGIPDFKITLEWLSRYQATSVRLSYVLDSISTGGEYLRQFHDTIVNKQMREEKKGKLEKEKMMREHDKSLLGQLYPPDPAKDSEGYLVWEVPRLVVNGEIDTALALFFASEDFQSRKDKAYVLSFILNKLIKIYSKEGYKKLLVRRFVVKLKNSVVDLSKSDEDSIKVVRMVQQMAGQTLTIFSWIDRNAILGSQIQISTGKAMAVTDRGASFIDAETLPAGIQSVSYEGGSGYYYRGQEYIDKIGESNIIEALKFDVDRFERDKQKIVLYLMNHGIIKVPQALEDLSESNQISTIHETLFINDTLPGSFQTTSTGAGHFQNRKLDVKYVTAGSGVQVNVLYDEKGNIKKVIAQQVEAGDWGLALPGYVDYMINLGGLMFNDNSVMLTPEDAKRFNPDVDFSNDEKLEELARNVDENKYVPYIGMLRDGRSTIVKVGKNAPDIEWKKIPQSIMGSAMTLFDLYNDRLTVERVITMFDGIYSSVEESSLAVPVKTLETVIGELATETPSVPARYASLGKIAGLDAFIRENSDFLAGSLGRTAEVDKLIRIPVETIEAVGVENIKGFFTSLQDAPHGFIELFSSENPHMPVDVEKYGLTKQDLPESLAENNRSRANTITIFPVLKGEVLPDRENNIRWKLGGMLPMDTIVTPVGFNYDRAGIVRSVLLGLRLAEIAGDEEHKDGSIFVSHTLAQYMELCRSQGQDMRYFNLRGQDLVDMARGDIIEMIHSLNTLIKFLPIMPVNVEELRSIYEHAKEAMIRA